MKKKSLPMYGVGPIYVAVILVITIAFIILSNLEYIPKYYI